MRTLQTLVVTSGSPVEGKTTTASNLAITFPQQGMSVLLVDTDLRRSRQHELSGTDEAPGVTELVLGMAELDDVLGDTPVEGLMLLPAGTSPPAPAELLGGPGMTKVPAELRHRFDVVIMDTPAALAVTAPVVQGRVVDGVLLVFRAGSTDRKPPAR